MKIQPEDAFIVVDVQRDFCPGGALGVSGGDAIVPVVNGLLGRFGTVVFSRDWHPADHCSFAAAPQFVDKSWPAHCVAGTPGAEFHPDLRVPADALVFDKGTDREREQYSVFYVPGFQDTLRARGVKRLFLAGLATDYCVLSTALDAVEVGFEVWLVEDAVRGVDVPPGTAARAVDEMLRAGVKTCAAGDVE